MFNAPTGINLWLTDYCNHGCNFCLGRDIIDLDEEEAGYISESGVVEIIKWVKEQDVLEGDIHLLGGEPTQHPNFTNIVEQLASARVYPGTIFTNGLCDEEKLLKAREILKRHGLDHFSIVVNVNHPSKYTDSEWEQIRTNLDNLHHEGNGGENWGASELKNSRNLSLAMTFYEPDQSYEYIIDLAREFNVHHIRSAASKPSTRLNNEFVDHETFREMKPTFMSYIEDCVENNIVTGFECVIIPCVFTLEEWRYITNFCNKVDLICNFPLDVLPDLTVIHCCAMADTLGEFKVGDPRTAEKLEQMQRKKSQLQSTPLDRCRGCSLYEEKMCQGGCLNFRLEDNY